MRIVLETLLVAAAVASIGPTQSARWIQSGPATSPAVRSYSAMAFDASRRRTVMFGGIGPRTWMDETWAFDGATWTQLQPRVAPTRRSNHAMVHDAARGRVLLFGGWDGSSHLGDTWEWDGVTWRRLTPTISPGARSDHALAFDANRGRVVLFGGRTGNYPYSYLNDTWEWDGSQWTRLAPTTVPAARSSHAMAFDAAQRRVVLVGGAASTPPAAATWLWDGSAWVRSGGTPPPLRYAHAMAYDATRARTVMFGGASRTQSSITETWEWDGRRWYRLSLPAEPPGRWASCMAYDSARQRCVLFGGYRGSTQLADTWEYTPLPALSADTATISNATGGLQALTLHAGWRHRHKQYWIFGSASGTSPGVTLGGVHIALNPDVYTDITIQHANSINYRRFSGFLDDQGMGTAAFYLPKGSLPSLIGLRVDHAYLVYDARAIYLASNPVAVRLVR